MFICDCVSPGLFLCSIYAVPVVSYIGLYFGPSLPDTRTVVVGKETGVGEVTIVGSKTGMTETKTGTVGMEVAINQAPHTPTTDTTPTTRDAIMTATDH